MTPDRASRGDRWLPPVAAGLLVLAVQLWLVAAVGTDVPFQDQWDIEGRWLYPRWLDGSYHWADLLRSHNEHRIVWTQLLDLGLFSANGNRWDPLVQLAAGAFLHGAVAALLASWLGRGRTSAGAWLAAAGMAAACLPLAGWHNALWGFQSHVYFALIFSILALGWLEGAASFSLRQGAGAVAAVAALLAEGAGAAVPVALLAGLALRSLGTREALRVKWTGAVLALGLLVGAWCLHVRVPEHDGLRADSVGQFFLALGRLLAWPHSGQPLAALVLNLPLALAVTGRLAGRRTAAAGEDFVTLLGLWAAALAVAAAWSRGGSGEFAAGVPSRYADFLVLLPLANAWCAVCLWSEPSGRRPLAAALASAWGLFLIAGWVGLAGQVWQGLIGPRRLDPDAPVRLVQAFQRTDDAGVFAGQPRVLVAHPDPAVVRSVLRDPRLQGALPPSLQPALPRGPLSRAVRWLLGR